MLEQTDAITNEVLQPITFVLAYPTVFKLDWNWIQTGVTFTDCLAGC